MPVQTASITTLTLNPALDQAVAIDALLLGCTNRCSLDALDPGGKGINASRVIARQGRPTRALGFIAGPTGALLRSRLDAEHVDHELLEVDGATRINIMIYERGTGRRTRILMPGPIVEPARLADLWAKLEGVGAASVMIVAGSLPAGLPDTTYRDLVRGLAARGVRTIVDTSGSALLRALEAKPFLIKPNVEEAEEALGRPLPDEASLFGAADELRRRGARYVVISRGPDGAVASGPDGAWSALPPPVDARSSVGSGDAMVAGLAIAFNERRSFEDGLRLGTAMGAATAMTPGTHLCEHADVERLAVDVIVTRVPVRDERALPV